MSHQIKNNTNIKLGFLVKNDFIKRHNSISVSVYLRFYQQLKHFLKIKNLIYKDHLDLMSLLKKNKLDYVFVNEYFYLPQILLARYQSKIDQAFIIPVYDVSYDCSIRFLLFAAPLLTSKDVIMTPSYHAKKIIEKLITPSCNIIVSPLGIDINQIKKIKRVKRKSKFKEIVFLGRLDHDKGIETLISIMPKIKKYIPNIRLKIIGPLSSTVIGNYPLSDYYFKLKKLIKSKNLDKQIQFKGYLSDTQKYAELFNSDLFINPTLHHETFCFVNIEALSCNLPLVISDLPVFREYIPNRVCSRVKISKNGSIIFLNKEELADKTIRLLKDNKLLNKMRRAAIKLSTNYDYQPIILNFLNELNHKKESFFDIKCHSKILLNTKIKNIREIKPYITEYIDPDMKYIDLLNEKIIFNKKLQDALYFNL